MPVKLKKIYVILEFGVPPPKKIKKEPVYRDPLYTTWRSMKDRCLNPKATGYRHYGGRGITVWEGWVNDFRAFKAYVGEKPDPDMTLGRIDNNGGYEPGNVEWQTWKTQARNKRNNTWINYQGQKKTLAEWAVILSKGNPIIARRINEGWSFEKALTTLTPEEKRNKRRAEYEQEP